VLLHELEHPDASLPLPLVSLDSGMELFSPQLVVVSSFPPVLVPSFLQWQEPFSNQLYNC
jgi:hypothetical protein